MRYLATLPFLFIASGSYALSGPTITAPDVTEGVTERRLEISQIMSSERPVPRPASLRTDEESGVKSYDVADFPLPSWVGKNAFILHAQADPDFLRRIANGEHARTGPFVLNTESLLDYDNRTLALDTSPVNPETVAGPEDVMKTEILRILANSYDMDVVDGDDGYEQLLNLAEGRGADEPAAVISSDSYEFPDDTVADKQDSYPVEQMRTASVGTVMGMDPAAAILNSLSQQQVAAMSPEQISALVMAAHGNPMDIRSLTQQAQPTPMMQAPVHTVMAGIPSLDYRGDDLPRPQVISAADVPSGSMPFSDQTMAPEPQEPIVVGDGQNILLKGWKLGLTGSGGIGMYVAGDPGSVIEISEGMVVGPLGKVDKLTMEQGNIIARFTSGEVLTSPAALVSMASL